MILPERALFLLRRPIQLIWGRETPRRWWIQPRLQWSRFVRNPRCRWRLVSPRTFESERRSVCSRKSHIDRTARHTSSHSDNMAESQYLFKLLLTTDWLVLKQRRWYSRSHNKVEPVRICTTMGCRLALLGSHKAKVSDRWNPRIVDRSSW